MTSAASAQGPGQQDKVKAPEKSAAQAAPARPADAAVAAAMPDSITENSVTVGGQKIAYRAVAGTLTVGSTSAVDATLGLDGRWLPEAEGAAAAKPDEAPATARMFYVAYFKKDAARETRPVMFLYNGGPGSSTMWLHMGSFGPRRVVVPDTEHKEGAPYTMVENQYSLLDATDLVFIDAPGTGFSRIFGKDKEKSFYGIDQDAQAFERFIRRFLTKYDRWNSPKYLFGESYGTPRSAVISGMLQNVDLNGIVLLSAILSFDNSVDGPRFNPGVDQAYALALPTYAATAYYHKKLPNPPAALEPFLTEAQNFALGDYMAALLQGSELPAARKQAIAEKLHQYTGLPVAYLLKSNLRVDGGSFSKMLEDPENTTTGRLDTRYQGPDMNPLSESAEYDPQSTAISSAYTTAINEYLRNGLKFGADWTYKPSLYGDGHFQWDMKHQQPGMRFSFGESLPNVMPDLAYSMKMNPKMHILLAGGYFDLATPYFEGIYEMRHLPVPDSLQKNITYRYYQSGHMVYVNENVLEQFHDDVASFVRATEGGK
jgi:carboxypeptidase C (cathepsin A)